MGIKESGVRRKELEKFLEFRCKEGAKTNIY